MVGAGLRATITAKAPARLPEQTMRVTLNGRGEGAVPLGHEWSDTMVELPREWAGEGENQLCLEWSAGAAKADQKERLAAHVLRIQIQSQTPTRPTPVWGIYHARP
jgi:hypothetical protein